MTLTHRVTEAEADLVRHLAAGRPPVEQPPDSWRIFLPRDGEIEIVEAPSGRGRCRSCGGRIEKGAPVVRFGFDPYSTGPPSSWGRLAVAYVHARAADCSAEEEAA